MVTKQAKVTGEGQITIPTEVREALGLREGDMIAFEAEGFIVPEAFFEPLFE